MTRQLEETGRFPFGQPATRRPPRAPAELADLFVLGVYPSALHVRWTRPDGQVVGALAVADEPEVFWDGADADQRIAQWRDAVDWQDSWGRTGAAGGNGSSGRVVASKVLDPLGVSPDRTYFSDCLPNYFVKTGAGSQGQRIRTVYNEFAATVGEPLHLADLPDRPKPGQLVERAIRDERNELLDQIQQSGAARIVTLGQEAADVLVGIAGLAEINLGTRLDYGAPRKAIIGTRALEWIPLTHPGNRTPHWVARHDEWARVQG